MPSLFKRNSILMLILGATLALGSMGAYAQNIRNDRNNFNNRYMGTTDQMGIYQTPTAGVEDNNAEAVQDTTKKAPKIRKPLESYFFNDSIRKLPNFAWRIKLGQNDIDLGRIDTTFTALQNDYPHQKYNVGSAYLGNLGGASMPLDYSLRPDYRDFEFAEPFDAYMTSPEKARFFNVKNPFTHFGYTFAGQAQRLEENFHILHAQNISPTSGFNIEYRSMGTKGTYANQKSRDKALSAAFSHTGKKYSVHAGYIFNSMTLRENGGVQDDRNITDTVFEMPELVPVNLMVARNILKNNTFYMMQSYGVPLRKLTVDDFSIADKSSFFVGHSVEYSRFYKKYTDTRDGTTISSTGNNYYDNWLINPTSSNDSIFESRLSNRLFLQIQPWDRNSVVGVINAGIGHDMHKYRSFNFDNYISGTSIEDNKSSTYLYGSAAGSVSKYFSWRGDAKYHPFGYRSQDISVGGEMTLSAYIKNRPITLTATLRHEAMTPGYWTSNYLSNHYMWRNSFTKENETRIAATLNIPALEVELGAWNSISNDKIYFGADKRPKQFAGAVNVTGLYVRKDFSLGGFHLNHRVLLQHSSEQEVIPVPMASIYLSYYYQFTVKKDVLQVQVGFDTRYNTSYYAFGYNPATAGFYNQREKKIGEYPFVDLFLVAKWKRMRILLKFDHVNNELFGGRNYFTVLHHPINKRMLKFGFSWAFYD